MASNFLTEMFSLIAAQLEYNLAATVIFWVAAMGVWPYIVWMFCRPTSVVRGDSAGNLVIVRGGDLPTEYYCS